MSQLSFFSAEVDAPRSDDLAGLLAAQGQALRLGESTRVSVVVDSAWRLREIALMITEAGLVSTSDVTVEGHLVVGTTPSTELTPLAAQWTAGAVKTVPSGWVPGPRALRMWVAAAGSVGGDCYILGLDPHSEHRHNELVCALVRVGIAPTLVGARGAAPALRITSARRLRRLREMVGEPPPGPEASANWP